MVSRTVLLNAVDPKDPLADEFYGMNWAPYLNTSATITNSDWDTLLTQSDDSVLASGTDTVVKLAGGIHGQDYVVKNTVTTSDGETLVAAGVVRVRRASAPYES